MAIFPVILTDAGREAIADAVGNNTTFSIDRIEIGTGQYTPVVGATDLTIPFNPVRRLVDPAGIVVGTDFQFTFTDDSDDAYNVGEVGVFSGNTLVFLASQVSSEGWLFSKNATIPLLVPVAITVQGLDLTVITFNTSNPVPLATERIQGLIRIADSATARAGLDDLEAMTAMKTRQAFDSRIDNVRPVNRARGNQVYQATASISSIFADKEHPQIRNVVGVNSDGTLTLGLGSNLPVLVVGNIGLNGGLVYSGGTFDGLRLHSMGATGVFEAGDDLFMLDDLSGFSTSEGVKVGLVLGGNQMTGLYDVVIDLWSSFLGDSSGGYLEGYEAGYAAGRADYQGSGYSSGYNAGESAGYSSGYSAGQIAGYSSGYTAGHTDGGIFNYGRGYADGQAAGYNAGYAACEAAQS